MPATAVPTTGAQLGYARVSTGHQSLDQQLDALTAAGVNPKRVYSDKLSGASTREQRPGLASLLDYARPGDAIVVAGIDRLGRNAAEVMSTIRELRDREIVLRSLREGIDTTNATGRMIAGVLASLAELELELGRERRAAAREARRTRGQSIGRPRAAPSGFRTPDPLIKRQIRPVCWRLPAFVGVRLGGLEFASGLLEFVCLRLCESTAVRGYLRGEFRMSCDTVVTLSARPLGYAVSSPRYVQHEASLIHAA
jgi:DNA invertase Pin-like site-specific DNA recombinase